jgi:hypothetical protein
MRNAQKSRSQSKGIHEPDMEVAHQLVPGLESLPEIPERTINLTLHDSNKKNPLSSRKAGSSIFDDLVV